MPIQCFIERKRVFQMADTCFKCKYEKYIHGDEDFKCMLHNEYITNNEPCAYFEHKEELKRDDENVETIKSLPGLSR